MNAVGGIEIETGDLPIVVNVGGKSSLERGGAGVGIIDFDIAAIGLANKSVKHFAGFW